VKAHEAALRVLGEGLAVDEPLRIDQAACDRALFLATRGGSSQRRVALVPPLPALAAYQAANSGRSS
jgi:hypothetical protein